MKSKKKKSIRTNRIRIATLSRAMESSATIGVDLVDLEACFHQELHNMLKQMLHQ